MTISVNAYPLEPAAAFLYLVHIVAFNNNDWASLYQNLHKAWSRWGMVAKVLTRTGAMMQTREMLYRALV